MKPSNSTLKQTQLVSDAQSLLENHTIALQLLK